jgi:tetratricopeptide (TPR) repeat protein
MKTNYLTYKTTIMKKVILTTALFLASVCTFAQQKNVKDAKSIIDGTNPDFAKAEQLINAALNDPATKNDPETWNVAGLIQKKINTKEMEKAYLKKPCDSLKLYNSILNMYQYFVKCDELAQVPNEKGKIKNKYRKDITTMLLADRPNLINGGIQSFNTGKNADALKFFGTYIDSATYPMLLSADLQKKDTILSQVSYYATLAANKVSDNAAVKKYAPLAFNDKENGKFAMQLLADTYKQEKDSVQFLKLIQDGIAKYPDNQYFFANLIDYYAVRNQNDKAMEFADQQLTKDPNNKLYVYVKAYLYHNMKQYDKAIPYYEKAVQLDPSYAEAYSNLGLVYLMKAQDLSDKLSTNVNSPNFKKDQESIKALYEKAKPNYEKARQLKPDSKDLWGQGLYRVYYYLKMGPQFEEMEKIIGVKQ